MKSRFRPAHDAKLHMLAGTLCYTIVWCFEHQASLGCSGIYLILDAHQVHLPVLYQYIKVRKQFTTPYRLERSKRQLCTKVIKSKNESKSQHERLPYERLFS
jgi:uncharacterized membrane protein YhdT